MTEKRRPQNIKLTQKQGKIIITDTSTGKKLYEITTPMERLTFLLGPNYSGKSSSSDYQWWIESQHPAQWNLRKAKIDHHINFSHEVYPWRMWLDAKGDLVFWDGNNSLDRYRYSDGSHIDNIHLGGYGPVNTLAFMADNKRVVYDRDGRLWNTSLVTHRSDSLPYISFYAKAYDFKDKTNPVLKSVRHTYLPPKFAHERLSSNESLKGTPISILPTSNSNDFRIFLKEVYGAIN